MTHQAVTRSRVLNQDGGTCERLDLAESTRSRRCWKAAARSYLCGRREGQLDFRLLGDLECVVNFDPEVPDRAFKFRMTEQARTGQVCNHALHAYNI